jgi:hypothetical protein
MNSPFLHRLRSDRVLLAPVVVHQSTVLTTVSNPAVGGGPIRFVMVVARSAEVFLGGGGGDERERFQARNGGPTANASGLILPDGRRLFAGSAGTS